MTGFFLPLILVIAGYACSLCAQDTAKPGNPASSRPGGSGPSAEDSRQVSPEMQSLTKAIAGDWSTSVKLEPSEAVPNGGVGHGEEIWRAGPGGFTLLEEGHNRMPFGERFLLALMWWDKSTNSFHGMLCNGSGPAGCNVESTKSILKWDGKQLVIDMEFPNHGKRMMWHEAITDFTPTSFTQTGDIGEVGGVLKRSITIHATKSREVRDEFMK